jgi:PucR C-terminal helix-turn-helix domain/GGDEF-like domain
MVQSGELSIQVPVLRQILEALGPSPLSVLAAPAGLDIPVSDVLVYEPRASLPPINHAVLLAVGVNPRTGEASELAWQAARAGHSCLVIKSFSEPTTELAAAASAAKIALLAADEAMTWHHLDALLSSALAATPRSARDGSTPVGDLFALANAIAAMVGGATAIEDPHQRILAYSTLPGQVIDEERRQGILGLQVPYTPANDDQYRELGRTARVCRFASHPDGLPRMGVAVRAGNEALGSIWVVDATGELGPDAEQALSEAAGIAALHVLAARTAADVARRQRADLLQRILADPASVRVVAPQLGLSPNATVAVAAFIVASGDPEGILAAQAATRLTDMVNVYCEAHYGRYGCALIEGTVYALLPASDIRQSHRDLVADIARRAQASLQAPIRAGLGSLATGLNLAASSRQDADLVLRVLADQPDDPERPLVATIDEVRASATLAALTQLLSHNPRMSEGTGPGIRAYDHQHGTAYSTTLLAYLSANSDISATARGLNVHPNTCRYRLARAEQIFGFRLANPDERLLLWLQLRLGISRDNSSARLSRGADARWCEDRIPDRAKS